MSKICPAWIALVNGAFTLVPDRAKVVELIYTYAADLGLGHRGIAKRLNADRVPTFPSRRGSKVWLPAYVHKILTDPAVIGTHTPHRVEIDPTTKQKRRVPDVDGAIEGYFQAAIPKALYLRVHGRQQKVPAGRPPAQGTVGNVFRGLTRCASCGQPMTLVNKDRGRRYLACSQVHRGVPGNKCSNVGWRYEQFENVTLTVLHRDIDWYGLSPRVKEAAASTIAQLEEHLAELRLSQREHAQALERLIDKLERVEGDSPALTKRLTAHETALKDIAAEEKQVSEALDLEREKLKTADSTAKGITQAFAEWMTDKRGDPSARLRLATVLRENVEVIRLDSSGDHRSVEVVFRSTTGQPAIRFPFDALVSVAAVVQGRHGLPLIPAAR
jgi:hypothetical protein